MVGESRGGEGAQGGEARGNESNNNPDGRRREIGSRDGLARALLMPIPKAMVAQMTLISSFIQAFCTRVRSSAPMSAW